MYRHYLLCKLSFILPPLEVELHDGEAEQEGEEHREHHDHRGHQAQPAVLEAEVVLHEDLHGDAVIHRRRDVAELRHDQPIQRPRHGARPAVPLPPDRHFLYIAGPKMAMMRATHLARKLAMVRTDGGSDLLTGRGMMNPEKRFQMP